MRRRSDPRAAMGATALIATAQIATATLAGGAAAPTGPIALSAEQRAHFKPLSGTLPHPPFDPAVLERQSAAGRTILFWNARVTSPLDNHSYAMNMVGRSPFGSRARASLPYVILFARVHLPDGTVLDPTKPAACDTATIRTRFVNSPLFSPARFVSNGVDVSGAAGEQFVSAFQRANFWSQVNGSTYGVVLTAAAAPIVIDLTAPAGSGDYTYDEPCPSGGSASVHVGEVDVKALDVLVQKALARYAQPNQVALVVTYDVVEPQGGDFYLFGYHNAVPVAAGTQTYAVAAWMDPGFFFSPIHDMAGWSHELAEWADDPFVQQTLPAGGGIHDRTPAWGHVGQVSGCQDNLEVGDPLTGTAYSIVGAGGFTYSFQDLAFHDWFYRTPASGAGGKYSFQGGFTSDAGAVCSG